VIAQTKIVEQKIVNGINVDDLHALITGVKQDAAKGKIHWHVTIPWRGSFDDVLRHAASQRSTHRRFRHRVVIERGQKTLAKKWRAP
jgi:hypothetical protein